MSCYPIDLLDLKRISKKFKKLACNSFDFNVHSIIEMTDLFLPFVCGKSDRLAVFEEKPDETERLLLVAGYVTTAKSPALEIKIELSGPDLIADHKFWRFVTVGRVCGQLFPLNNRFIMTLSTL